MKSTLEIETLDGKKASLPKKEGQYFTNIGNIWWDGEWYEIGGKNGHKIRYGEGVVKWWREM